MLLPGVAAGAAAAEVLLLLPRIKQRGGRKGSGTCSVWYGAESGTDSAAAKLRKNALLTDRGSDEAGHQQTRPDDQFRTLWSPANSINWVPANLSTTLQMKMIHREGGSGPMWLGGDRNPPKAQKEADSPFGNCRPPPQQSCSQPQLILGGDGNLGQHTRIFIFWQLPTTIVQSLLPSCQPARLPATLPWIRNLEVMPVYYTDLKRNPHTLRKNGGKLRLDCSHWH